MATNSKVCDENCLKILSHFVILEILYTRKQKLPLLAFELEVADYFASVCHERAIGVEN